MTEVLDLRLDKKTNCPIKKYPIQLILPNIRSCHNVGAMFRTADCLGVEKLYLVGYTASPPKIQIDKVSLGAEKWIPWEKREDLKELIKELKSNGFSVIALEKNDSSINISEYKLTGPTAIIVGNEVDGLSEDIMSECDKICHIPLYGKKESMNVSIAAGIAMYVLSEKRLEL